MGDLAVRAASGKRLSVHSARQFVLDIARSLGCFLDDQDPAVLNTESLEAIYTQMIESTGVPAEGRAEGNSPSPGRTRRGDLSRALLEFHRYMMARHGKGPLEDQGLPRAASGLVPVDANLLTIEDYYAVLDDIDKTWTVTDFPERRRIARVLVILGFRCGLRRLEALHLPLGDLLPGDAPELLIRPSDLRGVKSRNALRRLPLCMLLTENELSEVLAWRNVRVIVQGCAPSGFLFGNAREGLDVLPQSIFEQINEILRKVTGDETMHFHHLRHSFATWTLLRLMLADMENPPDLFPHLAMTSAWLREAPAFRQAIYRQGVPTRKHAYLLAQLLGHGSPATSMEHYVHMADMLLAAYIERSPLMRPAESLVMLGSGIPRGTAQRWASAGGVMAIPLELWAKRRSKQTVARESVPRDRRKNGSNIPPGRDPQASQWIDAVWDFLYVAETSGRPMLQ